MPGGSATNISHEVGSKQLLPGLDEVWSGSSAGESKHLRHPARRRRLRRPDADVSVTVRTVKEKELPELNDEFAQLASEFDTIEELRDDLRERVTRGKRVEQIYAARDKALEQLVEAAEVPAPEGVVRDEVESRKQAMVDQLERIGASLEDYLAAEKKTEEQIDAELTEAATQGVKVQLLLDTLRRRRGRAGLRRRVRPRDRPPGPARRHAPAAVLRPAGALRYRGRASSAMSAGARHWRCHGADQDQGLGRQRGQPGRATRRRPRPSTSTSTDVPVGWARRLAADPHPARRALRRTPPGRLR